MIITAIPLENGKLCSHFGHCSSFALINVDPDSKAIIARCDVDAPPHEPGLLPTWLGQRGVNLIICGGMGPRALDLFAEKGIKVVTGAPVDEPETLVTAHFQGKLQTVANSCDH
jgi:predicted Fe-Mo cluster-binding NifX family protein